MRVILFRHGPAGSRDASRWPDDSVRPLTPRGQERTRLACAGLARLLATERAVIATSPLTRCAQTAQLLAKDLERAELVTLDALAPGGPVREILKFLSARPPDRAVVLVGHEPDLGDLAGKLLFGAANGLPLKKAGACQIQFVGDVGPGAGRLHWFMPPRMLRKLAGRKART